MMYFQTNSNTGRVQMTRVYSLKQEKINICLLISKSSAMLQIWLNLILKGKGNIVQKAENSYYQCLYFPYFQRCF